VRLLLDEHYSPEIARQLRNRGHDVIAVAERPDLTSLSDRDILVRGASERRAVVTNNVGDFARLFHEFLSFEVDHFGIIFTDDRSMPRNKSGVGLFVKVLDGVLTTLPADDGLRNQQLWLP
jgi:hypothetical protein